MQWWKIRRRKTNPSGCFPTLLNPLARSLLFLLLLLLSPHSTGGSMGFYSAALFSIKKERQCQIPIKKEKTFSPPSLPLHFSIISLFLSVPIFLLLKLSLISFFLFFLSFSQYRTMHITSFQWKQKGPGSQHRGPPVAARCFSHWQLNYIFMVTQIRLSCFNTQTRHAAKIPSTHLLVVRLPSRNCFFRWYTHM